MKIVITETTWLVLALLLCLAVSVYGMPDPTARSADVLCSADSDKRLDRCLKKGNKLLRRYFAALTERANQYNICTDSENFRNCILPLLEECPHLSSELHSHWRHVIHTVENACSENPTKRETTLSLTCIASEYGDPLVQRCDILHEFNQNQRTRSNCHFLKENINCKDTLITSKCGENAGVFMFGVFRLLYNVNDIYKDCHLPRAPPYSGFRYTDSGCEDFLDEMKECVEQNIPRQSMLPFRVDNELIINSTNLRKQHIKDKCRNFASYKNCMEPIVERCPMGPELIYEIDEDLRHYHTKMNFICPKFKDKQGYGFESVRCLNDLHDKERLETCNNEVWVKVDKVLQNVTSHDFHCKPEEEHVQHLKRELGNVVDCYEEVATEHCQELVGKTLAEFITIIFDDPAFLRHDYKADCVLHGPDTTTTPTTTTTTTTLKPSTTSTFHKSTASNLEVTHPHRHDHTKHHKPFQSTDNPHRVTWDTSLKPTGTLLTPAPRLSHSIRHRCSVFVLLVTLLYSISSFVT